MSNLAEDVTPKAESLIESLRDFGYTLQSAIADLVDNSLTARAKYASVEVASHAACPAHIAVADDGCGMSLDTLIAAMRLGTVGPQATRAANDLGRFGLGLKTASLSQGRCVTVVTKQEGDRNPLLRRLDIAHIRDTNQWQLLKNETEASAPYVERIASQKSGTAVVVENLDRATFLQVPHDEAEEHLGQALHHVREHLAMVFHRFLEDGIRLTLGSTSLSPWDPFLRTKSLRLAEEKLFIGPNQITVTPYLLPHHSKLTNDEHERASGPLGWNAHQGFYIYRCGRLIVPGTWLNLRLRKEEHFKLARLAVDLPNSVDAAWHLDVMKSHVAAPAYLRDDFRRIATKLRREASEVYRFRGEKQIPKVPEAERFVWRRETVRTGVKFVVDRTHPVVRALLHAGCQHEVLLEGVVALLEDTIPIAAILQDPSKALDGSVEIDGTQRLDSYVALMGHAERFLIGCGKSPAEARQIVLSIEPFTSYREGLVAHFARGVVASESSVPKNQ